MGVCAWNILSIYVVIIVVAVVTVASVYNTVYAHSIISSYEKHEFSL